MKRSKHFGFNCLNYRVPLKIGLLQAEIFFSFDSNLHWLPWLICQFFSPDKFYFEIIIPIKTYDIHMIKCWFFCPPMDHQAAARQSSIFFYSKPMHKASFDHFRKSQEFSGQVSSQILRYIVIWGSIFESFHFGFQFWDT